MQPFQYLTTFFANVLCFMIININLSIYFKMLKPRAKLYNQTEIKEEKRQKNSVKQKEKVCGR